jgi:hypothetical protein
MGNFGKTEALILVFVVLISLMILVPASVKTQTPHDLKNFSGTMDSYFLHGGIYAYTINVSMSIETEPNGEWVVNNSYQITWQISIVNFNPNAIVEPSDLSLTFHDPLFRISGSLKTTINQTSVMIGSDGFLKVEFTPDMSVNQADVQTLLLEDQNYSSQEQFKNAHWNQNFDIWINIVDSLVTSPIPTPTIPEFSWLIILPLSLFILTIAIMSKQMSSKNDST